MAKRLGVVLECGSIVYVPQPWNHAIAIAVPDRQSIWRAVGSLIAMLDTTDRRTPSAWSMTIGRGLHSVHRFD